MKQVFLQSKYPKTGGQYLPVVDRAIVCNRELNSRAPKKFAFYFAFFFSYLYTIDDSLSY